MLLTRGYKPRVLKGVLEKYLLHRSLLIDKVIVHYYTDTEEYLQLEVEYWHSGTIEFKREFIYK